MQAIETWLIPVLCIVVSPLIPLFQHRELKLPLGFRVMVSLLLFIGSVGFFGGFLSVSGELSWLPASFEWPIGYAKGIVTTDDGYYVVPHTPSGRVQIYDNNWDFKKGWSVNAHGGTFGFAYSGGDQINVITARGQRIYAFDLNGNLLSEDTYLTQNKPITNGSRDTQFVPTAPWLLSFTHPFLSLAVMFLSGLLFKAATSSPSGGNDEDGANVLP
ncbi:MAG: hypothetical protein GY943_34510 [Chloroflexi bacterium]|nr:hypothetical protein [Chloroflexota bacterium]